ncbi:hypothetical protein [Vibrio sp. WXL210]|uniref:hypothetical protein n=1 Tax=Vibrio sp. WXL210 TaxID=3450709 RepID=UPI003EC815AB
MKKLIKVLSLLAPYRSLLALLVVWLLSVDIGPNGIETDTDRLELLLKYALIAS